MSGMNMPEYVEHLRDWRRRVCERLGMDPGQVYELDDRKERSGAVRLDWKATQRQELNAGDTVLRLESDGANPPRWGGVTYLSPKEWQAVLRATGPKPEMLTREQELILKGLAAEREERP